MLNLDNKDRILLNCKAPLQKQFDGEAYWLLGSWSALVQLHSSTKSTVASFKIFHTRGVSHRNWRLFRSIDSTLWCQANLDYNCSTFCVGGIWTLRYNTMGGFKTPAKMLPPTLSKHCNKPICGKWPWQANMKFGSVKLKKKLNISG